MADTAIMGSPIDAQCSDREFIADLFTSYYTDRTPEWIWVLERAGRLVGYVMGCPETKQFVDEMNSLYPRIIWRALSRGSFVRPGSAGFLWRSIGDVLTKIFSGQNLEYYDPAYPAHAHINVLPEGQVATYQLVIRLARQLKRHGVTGLMGEIWEENKPMGELLRQHRFTQVHLTDMPGIRQRNGARFHVATFVRKL